MISQSEANAVIKHIENCQSLGELQQELRELQRLIPLPDVDWFAFDAPKEIRISAKNACA